MKFELYARTIVREEIEKGKKALRDHSRKADALREYIALREAQEYKKKLH
ncbi:hypothetical protein ACVV7M_004385 [Vibrio vulnificus]|nr:MULTISPECIES: hypothetical protein [Vibrionaceae]ELA8062775.1 hypothetical protein [Vibrio parahaemolyticus]EHI9243011.1 hypothetical protein [Vibrio vulnificus]ELV8679903.1 hypothetical protein [Vibrio vulnificus]MCU8177499.1 hypothetical protein [Vibrio vulnificus]OJI46690.1 hypothetical protein VVATL9824_02500 [Vibrio vulnificus]